MDERVTRIAKLAASVVMTVGASACGSTPIAHHNPPRINHHDPPPLPEPEIRLRDDGTCWEYFDEEGNLTTQEWKDGELIPFKQT